MAWTRGTLRGLCLYVMYVCLWECVSVARADDRERWVGAHNQLSDLLRIGKIKNLPKLEERNLGREKPVKNGFKI